MVYVNNSGNNFYLKVIYEIKVNYFLNGIILKLDFDWIFMFIVLLNLNFMVKKLMFV